jgi:hypothetical protein
MHDRRAAARAGGPAQRTDGPLDAHRHQERAIALRMDAAEMTMGEAAGWLICIGLAGFVIGIIFDRIWLAIETRDS